MRFVLDVENSTTLLKFDDGKTKLDMTPFRGVNQLVSVGIKDVDSKLVWYKFTNHKELGNDPYRERATHECIQELLDKSTLIIGHNLKHDIAWCKESGFKFPDSVKFWDTSIAEYVLSKGLNLHQFSLEDIAIRLELPHKKTELIQEYYDKNITMHDIPMAIVEEYGIGDLDTTEALYLDQQKRLALPQNESLLATTEMLNEFMVVLSEWQANGIKIDLVELDKIGVEFEAERRVLIAELETIARNYMGDTPFNLNSGDDMSTLLYSRRVQDKGKWKSVFRIGTDEKGKKLRRPRMAQTAFIQKVKELSTIEYKTTCEQCTNCGGTGKVSKILKSGQLGKPRFICGGCTGEGVKFIPRGRVAGFKFVPRNIKDTASNGFVTDSDTIEYLLTQTTNPIVSKFLQGYIRLNQLNTWIDTFVAGIKRHTYDKTSILYTNFNQIVTANGRLSSSDPNFQNIPRGKTFPVKKAIVSRFEGGRIVEVDQAQLEFRCAGELSGDKQIFKDIREGFDVHSFSRDELNRADGGARDRQDAKPETFKPVYGGTYGTPTQMAYYAAFKRRYPGLTKWQTDIAEFVLQNGYLKLPTGRQFRWIGVEREWNGQVKYFTQIVNYPVSGFATADIVPIACILIHWAIKKAELKSIPFLTVHDSVAVDCPPEEVEQTTKIIVNCMLGVREELKRRYNYTMKMPLEVEAKVGPNLYDMTKVLKASHLDPDRNVFINDRLDDIGT